MRQHCRILEGPIKQHKATKAFVFQYDSWTQGSKWKRDRKPRLTVFTSSGSYTVRSAAQLRDFLTTVKVLAPELVDFVTEAAALCRFSIPGESKPEVPGGGR